MHVCCKYYSDLTLRARRLVVKALSKCSNSRRRYGLKIASESTYEAQKFQNLLGEQPPDPPAFRAASGLIKAGRGLGMRVSTRKHSVPTLCPGIGFVLATPLDRVKRFPKTDSTLSSIDIVKKSDLCVPHMKQSGSILCFSSYGAPLVTKINFLSCTNISLSHNQIRKLIS